MLASYASNIDEYVGLRMKLRTHWFSVWHSAIWERHYLERDSVTFIQLHISQLYTLNHLMILIMNSNLCKIDFYRSKMLSECGIQSR